MKTRKEWLKYLLERWQNEENGSVYLCSDIDYIINSIISTNNELLSIKKEIQGWAQWTESLNKNQKPVIYCPWIKIGEEDHEVRVKLLQYMYDNCPN